MYVGRVFVTPEDILNKLTPEHKDKVNQCVFTDAKVMMDGSVDITYVVFNDKDKNVKKESERRQWYFSEDGIEL